MEPRSPYNSPFLIGTMRLGIWGAKMTTAEYERFIDTCVEMGLDEFDHADIYGHYTTESEFGAVLKKRPDLRKKLRITTKCGIKMIAENRPSHKIKSYDSSAKHIIWSAENSLKELGVEQLEVMLLHRPDYLMNPSEIAEAFEHLRVAGKVKYFGVSNFTTSQFALLNQYTPLITNQLEISILHRNAFEDGTLDQLLRERIIPTAWSPVGGGAIFSESEKEEVQRIQKKVKELAERHECQVDQLLLAWLRKHPSGIVPVLGSTKVERVQGAMDSLRIELSREEWYEVWEGAIGHEVA